MNDTTEDYRFQAHEDRITTAESRIHALEASTATMIANQAVTNERLSNISKKLDGLEQLEKDMNEIKPLVKNKADLERTMRNALIILACSGGAALLLHVLKSYLGHG